MSFFGHLFPPGSLVISCFIYAELSLLHFSHLYIRNIKDESFKNETFLKKSIREGRVKEMPNFCIAKVSVLEIGIFFYMPPFCPFSEPRVQKNVFVSDSSEKTGHPGQIHWSSSVILTFLPIVGKQYPIGSAP
jgi:hypothetical protein